MKVRFMHVVCAMALLLTVTGGTAFADGAPCDPNREMHPMSDAYECNDDATDARYLQYWHQLISDLSLYPLGDDDWFWYFASRGGELTVTVSTRSFDSALTLQVYERHPDGTVGQLLAESSNSEDKTETVSIDVASGGNTYFVRVLSAVGQTNIGYSLEISGTATNETLNRNPAANPNLITVTEATMKEGIDVLSNDVDPDEDELTVELHSDWYGRATVSDNKVNYLPATSLTQTHEFTYVAADGKGGRSKGTVSVVVQALEGDEAFPNAQGYGGRVDGGRNPDVELDELVYHVTSLDDNASNPQPGTLRYGVNNRPEEPEKVDHRIIVFTVAGPIHLEQELPLTSDLTIAGETAPGLGITLFGNPERTVDEALVRIGDAGDATNNVIVRYVRFRDADRWEPDGTEDKPGPRQDTIQVLDGHDIMIDHCSLSWGNDETFEIQGWSSPNPSDNITLQWCIVSETLETHSMGTLVNGRNSPVGHISMHHNLWAHNRARSPRITRHMNVEVINNIIYNWGGLQRGGIWEDENGDPIPEGEPIPIGPSRHGTKVGGSDVKLQGLTKANVFKNYYIAGPNSEIHDPENSYVPIQASQAAAEPGEPQNQAYLGRPSVDDLSNNYGDIDYDSNHDGGPLDFRGTTFAYLDEAGSEIDLGGTTIAVEDTSADQAYTDVREQAGAAMPQGGDVFLRDSIDERIISELEKRNGQIIEEPPAAEIP